MPDVNVLFQKGTEESYQSKKTAGTIDGGTFYETNDNFYLGLKKLTNAVDDELFSVVESSATYASVIKLYQGDKQVDSQTGTISPGTNSVLVATINIPKDMVIESGTIVTITYDDGKLYDGLVDVTDLIVGEGGTATAEDAGKYMKLIIANSDGTVLYISVKDLIDIYTPGTTTEVTMAIDNNNVITATIGKILGTKIIYRSAAAAHYDQVLSTDTFDPNEEYYTYDGNEYTRDTTVTSENFDTKVASGLYTYTPAVTEQSINAKVSELENYVGEIPSSSSATDVIGYVDEKAAAANIVWGSF